MIGGQRVARGARGLRRRNRAEDESDEDAAEAIRAPLLEDSEEDDEEDGDFDGELVLPEGKIGKKKLAKLQAKAERRAQREAVRIAIFCGFSGKGLITASDCRIYKKGKKRKNGIKR